MENKNTKNKRRTNPRTRRIRKSVLGVEKVEQEEEHAQKRRGKKKKNKNNTAKI